MDEKKRIEKEREERLNQKLQPATSKKKKKGEEKMIDPIDDKRNFDFTDGFGSVYVKFKTA